MVRDALEPQDVARRARDAAGKQPAFMTIVCAGIAVALLVANRRA